MPGKARESKSYGLSSLLAKPSGILLKDHVQHVWQEAKVILESFPFLAKKFTELTGQDLKDSLKQAVLFHDLGKEDPRWQQACQQDFLLYKQWCSKHKEQDLHSPETYWRYGIACTKARISSAPNLQHAGFRHEFSSLLQTRNKNLPLEIKIAIAAHHGKLSKKHQDRWRTDGGGAFKDLWEDFRFEDVKCRAIQQSPDANWQKCLQERYKTAAVRSLLQLADTRASRKESGKILPELKSFQYDFPKEYTLRPVQELALRCAHRPISILRAPTGSGKTDASLLWAKEQINRLEKADRLVIAMPTRFTSNALALNIKDNVSDTGLYHSSAWYTRYGNDLSPLQKDDAREAHKLSQLIATPVTVCTIDHLLMCLTATRELHHSTFFFLANSCVVLDEADFYDSFIQANIQVLLKALRLLKVPVLIMSATVPNSARQLYSVEDPIYEAERTAEPNRKLSFIGKVSIEAGEVEENEETDEDSLQLPAKLKEVFDMMIERRQGIVFANTTERGLAFYQYFQKGLKDSDSPLIFYHSRFTEPDKKSIEDKLIVALGRQAWSNQSARGIAVLTQIGEMSINISAPIMYSDTCPWDRLAQRVGRLNRFGEGSAGVVYVGEPWKKGAVYPAPYGSYISRKGWEETEAFRSTRSTIYSNYIGEPKSITALDFVTYVDKLYKTPEQLASNAQTNQNLLKEWMQLNWMICASTLVEEDEGKAGEWKSRNIEKQEIIYTQVPSVDADNMSGDKLSYPFQNFDAFRSFQLEYGISCPYYLLEKGMKNGELFPFTITIGDDPKPETIYICRSYDTNIGLAGLGLKRTSSTSTKFVNNLI